MRAEASIIRISAPILSASCFQGLAFQWPKSEAIYLHDADALDWLGAIGAARIFGLVDPQGGQPDGPAAVKRLQNLLMQVPPGLVSMAGKTMLEPRVQELQRVLAELSAETAAYRIL